VSKKKLKDFTKKDWALIAGLGLLTIPLTPVGGLLACTWAVIAPMLIDDECFKSSPFKKEKKQ
jgi:hypothetical protein